MKSVAESNNDPIKYWSNNVGGTLAPPNNDNLNVIK